MNRHARLVRFCGVILFFGAMWCTAQRTWAGNLPSSISYGGPSAAIQPTPGSSAAVAASPPITSTPPAFEDYPRFIANFLESGGDVTTLESLLRDWNAITEELGGIEVRHREAGDLVVVHVGRPPTQGVILTDRLMLFLLKGQKVLGIFDSDKLIRFGYVLAILHGWEIAPSRLTAVAFTDRFCGAHTCYEKLHVVGWNGQDFAELLDGELQMPYPQYLIDVGQITAVSGHIQSAGAGPGRAYTEIWQWNGSVFTVTQRILGPPTVRMHLKHDADLELERGNLDRAIALYQQAIEDKALFSGIFFYSHEDDGEKIIKAYAGFKLMVAYAAQGQGDKAKTQYDHLMAGNPPGTNGYLSALLGQAFWDSYSKTGDVNAACAAAISIAEADRKVAEQVYIGYANRVYENADICRVSVPGP